MIRFTNGGPKPNSPMTSKGNTKKNAKDFIEKMKKREILRTKMFNGKRVNVCDYKGTCTNKAHMEVYPYMMGSKYENKGWSYLCKKHFEQEKKRLKGKLPYCSPN